MSTELDIRDEISEFVRNALYGPVGEAEELRPVDDNPFGTYYYGCGILFPPHYGDDGTSLDSAPDDEQVVSGEEESGTEAIDENVRMVDADCNDDEIHRADNYQPSAFGISFLCSTTARLQVNVAAASYQRDNRAFLRTRHPAHCSCSAEELLSSGSYSEHVVHADEFKSVKVRFNIRKKHDEQSVYMTVSVIHGGSPSSPLSREKCCYAQIALSIDLDGANFLPLNGIAPRGFLTDDERANALLYRNELEYAVGHGASVRYVQTDGDVRALHLDFLPSHDVSPADAAGEVTDICFNMVQMASEDEDETAAMFAGLDELCAQYEQWIEQTGMATAAEPQVVASSVLTEQVEKHRTKCLRALERMKTGIQLLKADDDVLQVFRWTNAVMRNQRRHGMLKPWSGPSEKASKLVVRARVSQKEPAWRPFQIAFLLSQIPDITNNSLSTQEHNTPVDLIWFPTGGGKTEAYLGLAAFTILWRRVAACGAEAAGGTAVVMRYTLRLLTAQQTERALALIAALEIVRRDNVRVLGKQMFTLGFFTGKAASHNTRKEALGEYNRANNQQLFKDHKFMLKKCPHCGREIGLVRVGKGMYQWSGVEQANSIGTVATGMQKFSEKTVVFRCPNVECELSDGIPFLCIDEDVAEHPPTFVIGTIDKFAVLPLKPEMARILGVGTGFEPPSLILQDELHLISGALGSIAGAYESMVEMLCTFNSQRPPKIVAATATIASAQQQCSDLWGRNMEIFPPLGFTAACNFFSKPDTSPIRQRRYLGIMTPHLSGVAALSATAAALLSAVRSSAMQDIKEGEPLNTVAVKHDWWWSLICYFNTLRELGNFSTLENADVRTLLYRFYRWNGIERGVGVYRSVELTSRFSAPQVTQWMDDLTRNVVLEKSETRVQNRMATDICRATNMIQVGLDISRLSLMLMYRQPLTTAEYIQASSRVGRERGGLIAILYRPQSSRDRSFYEHFGYYHRTLYRNVEPVSLTPCSPKVIERVMHTIVVGLYRILHTDGTNKIPFHYTDDGNDNPLTNGLLNQTLEQFYAFLEKRHWPASALQIARTHMKMLVHDWQAVAPVYWMKWSQQQKLDNPSLMSPLGDSRIYHEGLDKWQVMTSMRNVDQACTIFTSRLESANE